ncbi:hypothetical protein SteCoe_22298 [Stentor coeruleus]|uniref:Uncharacterized protein n=1 Tax=Stentor coeruleus TaxID=5963 RepID=A0A1R2BMS6_9CILI|nr:hypothetical protein SteCoe_22298 [Stentor coeruleus]
MSENSNIEDICSRVLELESQLSKVCKIINALQSENQELRKLLCTRNEAYNLKRPANALGFANPSAKKLYFKSDMITPEVKENKDLSDTKNSSSQRRQVMQDIVKNFKSNILPNYQDHLESERSTIPKLRNNDGRIILKNIRYLR